MSRDIRQKPLDELSGIYRAVPGRRAERDPVHVVYGGAHLYGRDTLKKCGLIALRSIEDYAPNFAEFARALWIEGADSLPTDPAAIEDLEFRFADNPEKSKFELPAAWSAWRVFQQTIEKLKTEPVEDYRIDFEDGYGIRSDVEEDAHCLSASNALAEHFRGSGAGDNPNLPGTGIRIKSLRPETRERAVRSFDLFLSNLVEKSGGRIPSGFAVTLPKITNPQELEILAVLMSDFEREAGLREGTLNIEILIETPESVEVLGEIVKACGGRCVSAHFGAYEYTARLGISASHQHIRHKACDFARNMMQVALTPLGIRLADSVTAELPNPLHRKENLTIVEIAENRIAVHKAWRKHFTNVTHSQINGFYQSRDIHPAQLPARFGAVYSFYLAAFDEQAKRLREFVDKATQAIAAGSPFDDTPAAEGHLSFFRRGLDCSAFGIDEIVAATGLSREELTSISFLGILEKRYSQTAN